MAEMNANEFNDGGVDFPSGTGQYFGMTLRDWFAGNAPLTLSDAKDAIQLENVIGITYEKLFTNLSKMRYAYADAMIAAREQVKDRHND